MGEKDSEREGERVRERDVIKLTVMQLRAPNAHTQSHIHAHTHMCASLLTLSRYMHTDNSS